MFRRLIKWLVLLFLIFTGIFLMSNIDKGFVVNDPEHLIVSARPPANLHEVLREYPSFRLENQQTGLVKVPLGQVEDAQVQLNGNPDVEGVSLLPVDPRFDFHLYTTKVWDMFQQYTHGDWGYIRYTTQNHRAFPLQQQLGEMIARSFSYLSIGFLLSVVVGYTLAVIATWKPKIGFVIHAFHKLFIGIPDFFAISLLQVFLALLSKMAGHNLVAIYQFGQNTPFLIPMLGVFLLPSLIIYGTLQIAIEREWKAQYILTAHSKGLARTHVLMIHLLRNTTEDLLSVLPRAVSVAVTSMVLAEVLCGVFGLGGYAINDSIVEVTSLPTTCLLLAGFVLLTHGLIFLLRRGLVVSTKEGD